MTRRRDLLPDEAKLWGRVARTTKAYKIVCPPIEPSPTIKVTRAARSKPTAPESPHLALKRAKAARLALVSPKAAKPAPTRKTPPTPVSDASGHKKVRRGKLDIDARIDLHGMRQLEAQTALAGIIARTRANHGRCILVITGKGRPIDPGEDYITPQAGVIRRRLPEWLSGPDIREHVSGFASAHAKDGGTGAYYVLLKSNLNK